MKKIKVTAGLGIITNILANGLTDRELRSLARSNKIPIAKYKADTAWNIGGVLYEAGATVTLIIPRKVFKK